MGNNFNNYTVLELHAMLWDAEAIPKRWMLSYILKKEAVDLMEALERAGTGNTIKLPDDYLAALKTRQDKHIKTSQQAKKDREEKFGVSAKTHSERLKFCFTESGGLTFTGTKFFDERFESSAGSIRGKMALAFDGANGNEYLFTRSEGKGLREYGVEVPSTAFNYSRSKASVTHRLGGKTLKDVFS